MQAHRMRIVIPEDHRTVVEFPETIRSGPVELIVLVPQENEAEEGCKPEGQGRMAALVQELGKDPRPFRELSPEERSARLEKVMGVGRGLMSTSEEFTKRKREEIEIEEQWKRFPPPSGGLPESSRPYGGRYRWPIVSPSPSHSWRMALS